MSPHITKLRGIADNLLDIPANEQCIGHLQVAVKDALTEIAEELERLNKDHGINPMTPPHNKEAQRQRFESWDTNESLYPLPLDLSLLGEEYACQDTRFAWYVWQAASEPIEELRECLREAIDLVNTFQKGAKPAGGFVARAERLLERKP